MPLAPYTWNAQDFLTATRLNAELYRIAGQPFRTNGIGWHSRRPLYAGFTPNPPTLTGTANVWSSLQTLVNPSNGGQWFAHADTTGLVGNPLDQGAGGAVNGSTLYAGGGAFGSAGGLGLVSTLFPFTNASGSQMAAKCGIGLASGSSPAAIGTQQTVLNAVSGAVFGLDIVDIGAGGQTGWFQGGSASITWPGTPGGDADGSGSDIRLQGFWASVYAANGNTVASLPAPVTSWTNSSVMTHALLNGNTGIAGITNLLNMPPLLRVMGGTSSVPNATTHVLNFGTPTYDTYSAWNNSSNLYTAPLKGVYLVYGTAPYANIGSSGRAAAGVSINSGSPTLWGPNYPLLGNSVCPAKVSLVDLNAGDTIQLVTQQSSGSTQTCGVNDGPLLLVLYLGMLGVPPITPVAADPTFLYQAATPGTSMPGQFNAHLANDLVLLTQRPYFLGYQGTQQNGINMATSYPVSIDTVGGLVHASNGDNYSGWNSGSNYYVCQVPGWYLAVQETFFITPTLTVNPMSRAGFIVNPGGVTAQDWYQQNNEWTGGGGSGAAAVGIYYLRAGDTITPALTSFNSAGTATSTTVTGFNSHFELMWLGE